MQLNWIVNTLYFLWTGNIMEWLYLPFRIFIFLHHYLNYAVLKINFNMIIFLFPIKILTCCPFILVYLSLSICI